MQLKASKPSVLFTGGSGPTNPVYYLLQVQGLQQNLFAAEVDTRRVTETLETVMQSHQQLQMTVEQLQTELGNKDAVISQLKSQM